MNHKMEINIDRITDPLIHDSQCYSMNKKWNVESNSMMIEWFVNDQCVIDDNNEQEYGIDGLIFENEWNWNQFTNKWKWWLNEWCDMNHNRLIVEFDDRFVEYGLMDVIIRMEWFEFLMYIMNSRWYHWIWWE